MMTTIGADSASSSSSPVDAGEEPTSQNPALEKTLVFVSRILPFLFPSPSLVCPPFLAQRKSRSNDHLHDFCSLFLSKSFCSFLTFSLAVPPVSSLPLELT